MGRVGQFFRAMFSEWWSGLSGPSSVPFAVASLWVSSPVQRVLYGSLAVILLLFSAYRIWSKQRDWTDKAESELLNLKKKYLDDQPKFGMDILSTEGMKQWMETGDPVQFHLQHLGGRMATGIRFDPILSKMGKFSLQFDSLPHLHLSVRNMLIYEIQDVGAPTLGYRDRDKIGNVSKEMLRLFLLDSPKGAGELDYPLIARYSDNDEERTHTFHLRFDPHRFKFARNTV
jgi:hypothetical protein